MRRCTSRCLWRRTEKDEEEDVSEDMGVEVDVLLAPSWRGPRFSAGTLQRGIPIPRCCL